MTTATTTASQTTHTATHYRLSIELSTRTSEAGETLTTADLIATGPDGGRHAYCGPAPCSTQGEALELMARVFAWERKSGRTLDPTLRPSCWAAERPPTGDVAREGGPEVALTPSVWGPKAPANVAEVVEVVAPVEARRARGRKVDAAKVRRARAAGGWREPSNQLNYRLQNKADFLQ